LGRACRFDWLFRILLLCNNLSKSQPVLSFKIELSSESLDLSIVGDW
jgi:hypothetical protein